MARSSRWTRARVICILLLLSLSPGLVAAAFRERCEQLPPGVHLSVYLLSAVLLVVACSLILMSRQPRAQEQDSSPATPDNDS
jgi:hypothetical protein